MKFHSQYQQDRFVYEKLFSNKRDGVFLDIGAHDGVTFSNSLFFEELGWTGLCIEPNPTTFEKLKNSRKAKCIQGGISDTPGKKEFLKLEGYTEMLSGLIENYHPAHLQRIQSEIQEHSGKAEKIMVDCFNLNDILKNENISHVDFMSLDTEGGEFEILRSINMDAVRITAISVENFYKDKNIRLLLADRGYQKIADLGCDEIYALKT